MIQAIEQYKEYILNGLSSSTASQIVQGMFELDNETLAVVADAGERDAMLERDNKRELTYIGE